MVTAAQLEAKRAEVAAYRAKLMADRQASPPHTLARAVGGAHNHELGFGELPDRWLADLEAQLRDLEFRAKLPQG